MFLCKKRCYPSGDALPKYASVLIAYRLNGVAGESVTARLGMCRVIFFFMATGPAEVTTSPYACYTHMPVRLYTRNAFPLWVVFLTLFSPIILQLFAPFLR